MKLSEKEPGCPVLKVLVTRLQFFPHQDSGITELTMVQCSLPVKRFITNYFFHFLNYGYYCYYYEYSIFGCREVQAAEFRQTVNIEGIPNTYFDFQ